MNNAMKEYYHAYDERYKTAHQKGVSWASQVSTPIVLETLRKYGVRPTQAILEIGCGEGRDARAVLEQGYNLLATDVSPEAIRYCRASLPQYESHFRVLDCLTGGLDQRFHFIYAVAVIHMLVPDEDRAAFYRFVRDHLKPEGLALICSMGDGEMELQSDVGKAFEVQERNHETGTMRVAATSCRMVSKETFTRELRENRLEIVEQGLTQSPPEFNSLLYAVVRYEREREEEKDDVNKEDVNYTELP